MTTRAWIFTIVGLVLTTATQAAIAYDFWALRRNRPTVSEYVCDLGERYPLVPLLVAGCLGYVAGVLSGHFHLPLDRR